MNKKNDSVKVILIIAIVAIAGYFLYKTMVNRAAGQAGSVMALGGGQQPCIDTGTTQASRTYTFSELNSSVVTSNHISAGALVTIGEFNVSVGASTICTLSGVQIVSLNDPSSYINSVKIVDMDTNQVIASTAPFAQLFDDLWYLSINFPVGTYPLVANSTHHWRLSVKTKTGFQYPFLLGLGINGVYHTPINVNNPPPGISSQAIAYGLPIFQTVVRVNP